MLSEKRQPSHHPIIAEIKRRTERFLFKDYVSEVWLFSGLLLKQGEIIIERKLTPHERHVLSELHNVCSKLQDYIEKIEQENQPCSPRRIYKKRAPGAKNTPPKPEA